MTTLRTRVIHLAHQRPDLRSHLLPLLKEAALPSGTVGMFLTVLTSKLTQYDKRLQARDPNIYRLGHYLKASQEVEKWAKSLDLLDRSDAEALTALKGALRGHFTQPPMPPVANVMKQIDLFLATGKLPTLLR